MLRLQQAFNKMLFCFRITHGFGSFLRLVWNTKLYKWSIKYAPSDAPGKTAGQAYDLQFNDNITRVFLRTFSGDLDIFYEIFWNKVYKLPDKYYNETRTIVDLGANIGLATLFFSLNCPRSTIYTMEPEPGNFIQLGKNLEEGILHQHIIPINAAIDKEDGTASIQTGNLRYNCNIIPADAGYPLIKTMSVKAFMETYEIKEIDILKIDIEGSEQRLFEGDVNWLDHVRYLLIEFHAPSIKTFCLEILVEKNFSISPVKTATGGSGIFLAINNHINESNPVTTKKLF